MTAPDVPADDEVRTVLDLVSASLADPEASDAVAELEYHDGGRLFGVQPSEKSSTSYTVLVRPEN